MTFSYVIQPCFLLTKSCEVAVVLFGVLAAVGMPHSQWPRCHQVTLPSKILRAFVFRDACSLF